MVQGNVQTTTGSAVQTGSILPVGTLIRTGGASEITLHFFDGTVATIQSETEVSVDRLDVQQQGNGNVKETTTLDLRRGGVVVSLDPAKKDITHFSVRTPRGTAIARGTVFAVRVTQDQANATVGTMSGVVTFVTDKGEVSVAYGQISNGNAAQSVAAAVAAEPTLASMFTEAALSLAGAIGQGAITDTAGTPNLVASVLAAVVQIAAQAAPDQSAQLTQAVIAAIGSSNTALSQVVTQAAAGGSSGTSTSAQSTTTILPALDQTQVVVSPSKT